MHSFVGLAGYYRKLIKDFAQREAPLRNVLANHLNEKKSFFKDNKPKKEFVMTDEAIHAFKDLKEALIANPIVALPDFSGKSKFELHTDASDLGISAILTQISPGGKKTSDTLWF